LGDDFHYWWGIEDGSGVDREIFGVAGLRDESSFLVFLKPRAKLTFAREPAQLAFIP
jgi:hypothetical protein